MKSVFKSFTGMACPGLVALACLFSPHAQAQTSEAQPVTRTAPRIITLDPPTGWELQVHSYDLMGNARPQAPENFRHLGEATIG